ncbi:MAG: hypothetical protein R3Y60_02815 [bacterium]
MRNNEVKNEEQSIDDYLNSYNLTQKAKFMYKNGFVGNVFQMENLSGYNDVTYEKGFSGFTVLSNEEGDLFLALPETDEEENIFAYNVTPINKVTEEQYQSLLKISETVNKANVFNVLKISALVIFAAGLVFTLLITTLYLSGGLSLMDALSYISPQILTIGVGLGVFALLFKKK